MLIAAVNGKVVSLKAPLANRHPGAVDEAGREIVPLPRAEFKVDRPMPWVGNLTRNLIIHSQSATGTRGYIHFLNSADVEIAKKVAKAVRFSSGGLRFVKAAGFLVRGQAQVSMNLTDFEQTPIHRVFEAVRAEAARFGVLPQSSEIVGLVPKKAIEMTAAAYLSVENFKSDLILENRLLDSTER